MESDLFIYWNRKKVEKGRCACDIAEQIKIDVWLAGILKFLSSLAFFHALNNMFEYDMDIKLPKFKANGNQML